MAALFAFIAALIVSPQYSIDQCHDDVIPSYSVSGELFGDQNGDGFLSGSECEWR